MLAGFTGTFAQTHDVLESFRLNRMRFLQPLFLRILPLPTKLLPLSRRLRLMKFREDKMDIRDLLLKMS